MSDMSGIERDRGGLIDERFQRSAFLGCFTRALP
jgi:hypothetical protein